MSPAEMQARIAALEAQNKALRERVAEGVFHRQRDLNWTREAIALKAEAKKAREDEAWALDAAVTIHPVMGERQWIPRLWSVRYCDGVRTLEVTAQTIHAALRPIRAKVEGGTK